MSDAATSHAERLPPRALPILYFGFGYLCLGLAFSVLVAFPGELSQFFYQPKTLAVVHLVTLGWISSSILGAVYLIGPLAMRFRIPARWWDWTAFAAATIGTVGMVGHFWIDSYSGMIWSAGTLLVGLTIVGVRLTLALRRAPVPWAVKLHMVLAFVNVLVAGSLGGLIGFEKLQVHVLPGYLLNTVFAHAHVAALGWATMMVMGTGYRLFPMVLPAAMPKERGLWVTALLVEVGLVGLLVAWPARSGWVSLFAVSAAAGIGLFLATMLRIRMRPRSKPKGMETPDLGTLQASLSLIYLALSMVLGLALALAPPAPWKLQAAVVYGVFGLLGFLAQIVIGISARLLPMFAWMHAYVGSGFEEIPPSQYGMADRRGQMATLLAWNLGVPLLATGMWLAHPATVRTAAVLLLVAVLASAWNAARIVLHAFRGPEPTTGPGEK